jgi:hypothetical protein
LLMTLNRECGGVWLSQNQESDATVSPEALANSVSEIDLKEITADPLELVGRTYTCDEMPPVSNFRMAVSKLL